MTLHHIIEIAQLVFILFSAIILHEIAHGWTALKLGDPTAKNLGRLTLNPISHMDPVGSVILPGFLILLKTLGYPVFVFGWAKPVPVDYRRLRRPKTDMAIVALAGPVMNFLLACLCALALKIPGVDRHFFELAILLNLFLALFNLTPIPPLDGSRLVTGILPNALARPYARLEPYGILFVIILLWSGVIDRVLLPAVAVVAQWLGVRLW